MKKLIIPLLLVLILVSSCRTKQERARRLLDKANKLYPIENFRDTLLKIDTVLVVDTFIVVKKDTINIETIIERDASGNLITFKDKVLLDNEKATIRGTLNETGKLNINLFLKEKKIDVNLKIPFKYRFITKRMYYKSPPEIIKVKGLVWWIGLITIIFGLSIGAFKLYTGYGTRIFKR